MMMRVSRLLAACLVLVAAGGSVPAFADGKKGKQPFEAAKVPKLKTGKLAARTPCPLGPGDRFTTGERPTKHTYNCSGAFVVTNNVASSVTLPDHMETVPPIIHRAGEPDPCDRGCAPPPAPHAEAVPPPHPQPARLTVTLSDPFGDGGVGAGVTGGTSSARVYLVGGGSGSASVRASAVAFAFASATSIGYAGGGHGGGHGGGGCGCR